MFSNTESALGASPIHLTVECIWQRVQAAHGVVDLTPGEPATPGPAHLDEAGLRAIATHQFRYAPVEGIEGARQAVAAFVTSKQDSAYPRKTIDVAVLDRSLGSPGFLRQSSTTSDEGLHIAFDRLASAPRWPHPYLTGHTCS